MLWIRIACSAHTVTDPFSTLDGVCIVVWCGVRKCVCASVCAYVCLHTQTHTHTATHAYQLDILTF